MARPYTAKERKALKAEFLEAMEQSMGMLTTSARRVGISKETVSNWREADTDFDTAIKEIYDRNKEYVEGQLMTAIKNGNVASMMFYLKCKGGYQEKQHLEIEQKGDIDIKAAVQEIKDQILKD